MTEVLEFIKQFNVQTIIAMVAIMWYFTREIKMSIDNLDRDIREMNTRVSRLEGCVYGSDVYKKVIPSKSISDKDTPDS